MAFPLKKYYANTPCTFVGTGDIVYIPDAVEVTELEPTTGAIMMALNAKGSLLPSGYTRLAYLESTGVQTLSFDWTTDIIYTVDIACTKHATDSSRGMGIQVITYRSRYAAGASGWNLYASGTVGGAESSELNKRVTVSHELKYSIKKCSFGVNDTMFASQWWPTLDDYPPQYYNMWPTATTGGSYRIYKAHITDGGNKEMSFVPAISPDGTPCMYDLITETPYYGSGSGKFIAGISTISQLAQMSNNLPVATPVYDSSGVQTGPTITLSLSSAFANSEYLSIAMDRIASKNWIVVIHEWIGGGMMSDEMSFVPASFLESTGGQWIDTQLNPHHLSFTLIYAALAARTSSVQTGSNVFGTENWWAENPYMFGAIVAHNNNGIGVNTYAPNEKGSYSAGLYDTPVGSITIAEVNFNENYAFVRNGSRSSKRTISDYTDRIVADALTCGLFSRQSFGRPAIARVYSLIGNYSGVPAVNYIPAVNAEGVPCMFDTVTKKTFYNSGSGDFILGVETEYNLDAIIANLTTATPEYDTDGTTQIGPVIKISVPTTWNVDISDGSTSFAKKMYDAAFEKQYILQFSQH